MSGDIYDGVLFICLFVYHFQSLVNVIMSAVCGWVAFLVGCYGVGVCLWELAGLLISLLSIIFGGFAEVCNGHLGVPFCCTLLIVMFWLHFLSFCCIIVLEVMGALEII